MIVAGFGFRAAATVESLQDALFAASCGQTIDCIAVPSDKACSAVFNAFAIRSRFRVISCDQGALMRQDTETKSLKSIHYRGVGSVCEAAALFGAGPGSRLLSCRSISDDRLASCALAKGDGL